MITTSLREDVLNMIREERLRQVAMYGTNEDLEVGFGSSDEPVPWLTPFTDLDSETIEDALRGNYEAYKEVHGGEPTWMHLIREELAELFCTRTKPHAIEEAVQLAALCVSLCEVLLSKKRNQEEVQS